MGIWHVAKWRVARNQMEMWPIDKYHARLMVYGLIVNGDVNRSQIDMWLVAKYHAG
jgi:hypothetical protein